jgi:hypothetical protein
VTLPAGAAAQLRTTYGLAPATPGPTPPPALAPFVPSGAGWERSAALEDGFAPKDWSAQVWVDADRGLAYVSAKGE